MENKKRPHRGQKKLKGVSRKPEDLNLKQQLLGSPEMFITEKGSNEHLDKLALKIQLIGGKEFILADFVADSIAKYESKFKRPWWYRLADLYGVERTLMDAYVKPEFARRFLIQFAYGRFPYLVLRTLRSRNRKISIFGKRTKLFQHLTKKISEDLDVVIEQIYILMAECKTPTEFKMKYSAEYKIYFPVELF